MPFAAPSKPCVGDFTATSNILVVYVPPMKNLWMTSTVVSQDPSSLFVSSADRKISILRMDSPDLHLEEIIDLNSSHKSPVLSIASISDHSFMTSSMSGHIDTYSAFDSRAPNPVAQHAKYAIQVIVTPSRFRTRLGNPFCLAASAGWDQAICLYSFAPPLPQSSSPAANNDEIFAQPNTSPIGEAQTRLSLPTCPESILFVRHPDADELYLLVGRRDSTYLYYYQVLERPESCQDDDDGLGLSTRYAGRQNLAPHANSWVSFSPCCLACCPTDPTLIAVATSHQPHMKLILVRLLFPQSEHVAIANTTSSTDGPLNPPSNMLTHTSQATTPASQAAAELALAEREEAAINLHVSTMAPQTPYSRPQVVWRPDGSGLWVNGDDGTIRGVEARTGKIVANLVGHEVGSKVRTLWAGMVRRGKQGRSAENNERREEEEENEEEEEQQIVTTECLISGGFDKKAIIWDCSATS